MSLTLQAVRRSATTIALLACAFTLGIAACFAQDLGELARKERERQKNQPATHVYTNEDLQKPQILAPEDRARIEASRQNPPPPSGKKDEHAVNAAAPEEIPLGDVARHYRMLRQLNEIEQADKTDVLPVRKPVRARPSVTRPSVIAIPPPPKQEPRPRSRTEKPHFAEAAVENKIRVGAGDSLWKLAKQHLGDGAQWTRLAAANPQLKDPNLIRRGDWLNLPQEKTQASAGKIRIQKGDSLWKLAQANFGHGLAWNCIAQANPDLLNANLILAGQVLILPAHCDSTGNSARLR